MRPTSSTVSTGTTSTWVEALRQIRDPLLSVWPVIVEANLSVLWASTYVFLTIIWLFSYAVGYPPRGASPIPNFWGMMIATMCVAQLLTGVILEVSRTAGETAPIMFTGAAFFLPLLPQSVFDQTMALSLHLFVVSTQVPNMPEQLPFGVALVLGLVALVPALALAINEELWGLLVFDICMYVSIVVLVVFRNWSYELRAAGILIVALAIGIWVTVGVGPLSGGPAWLFTVAVFSGLLLGLKAALIAVVLNGFSLGVIGWLAFNGHLADGQPFFNSMARAVAAGANFLALNALAAISVSFLVHGLQATAEKEKASKEIIRKEQARLIEVREHLKNEVEVRKQAEEALRRGLSLDPGSAWTLRQLAAGGVHHPHLVPAQGLAAGGELHHLGLVGGGRQGLAVQLQGGAPDAVDHGPTTRGRERQSDR